MCLSSGAHFGEPLSPIMHSHHTFFVRTMSAAVVTSTGLDAVANDLAATVLAFGSQRVDCALEAIEIMRNAGHYNLNRFVILISTHFTFFHVYSFLSPKNQATAWISRYQVRRSRF
jgi:hypothetical protein